MSFKVIKSGFLSLIEDYGRFGFAQYGLCQSGVADEHAYCWANHLLENHFNDAILEITFGGCELKALTDSFIVVTGADLDFKIDGKTQPLWQVISIESGDTLTWSVAKNGMRTYLAVKGGFQTDQLFNSRSVTLREQIGLQLMEDDELLSHANSSKVVQHSIPSHFLPDYKPDLTLRLLPSYQFDQFDQQQKETFFNQRYAISGASDRTGCRLEGQRIQNIPSTMISEGISYGSVEITTQGLPIILLKDRPTIGGYPKIGTVFSLDLAKLAQNQSGRTVSFELIDIETAQKERRDFNTFFAIN